ncbi:hypothetical protein H4219_001265 [Mycoemilia scoparia]|uniref:Uncharacterized protein n=1 Tax=Mycoemilia scoparia TaxID=417184 RepID=A0A9W8DVM7_9FUNG|nr:hypothetical protein H4219_001265 [Mycoemilia scoparia]
MMLPTSNVLTLMTLATAVVAITTQARNAPQNQDQHELQASIPASMVQKTPDWMINFKSNLKAMELVEANERFLGFGVLGELAKKILDDVGFSKDSFIANFINTIFDLIESTDSTTLHAFETIIKPFVGKDFDLHTIYDNIQNTLGCLAGGCDNSFVGDIVQNLLGIFKPAIELINFPGGIPAFAKILIQATKLIQSFIDAPFNILDTIITTVVSLNDNPYADDKHPQTEAVYQKFIEKLNLTEQQSKDLLITLDKVAKENGISNGAEGLLKYLVKFAQNISLPKLLESLTSDKDVKEDSLKKNLKDLYSEDSPVNISKGLAEGYV